MNIKFTKDANQLNIIVDVAEITKTKDGKFSGEIDDLAFSRIEKLMDTLSHYATFFGQGRRPLPDKDARKYKVVGSFVATALDDALSLLNQGVVFTQPVTKLSKVPPFLYKPYKFSNDLNTFSGIFIESGLKLDAASNEDLFALQLRIASFIIVQTAPEAPAEVPVTERDNTFTTILDDMSDGFEEAYDVARHG